MKVFVVSKVDFIPDYKRPEVFGDVVGVFKESETAHQNAVEVLSKELNERSEWNDELYEALSGLDKGTNNEAHYNALVELNEQHGGDEESGYTPYLQVRVDEKEVS